MNKRNQIEAIIATVSQEIGVSVSDILSRSRKAHIVNARQISMWVSRWNTQTPLQVIARLHGCTNHANVIHACNQVDSFRKFNKNFKELTDNIVRIVNS